MFNLLDVKKKPDGIAFEEQLDLKEELQDRNSEILDLKDILAKGQLIYENGLYLLEYQLSYVLVLPSSRSMKPVELRHSYEVAEVFVSAEELVAKQDLVDEDLVLVLDGTTLSLSESVADNIILNIPLKVLTAQEETNDEMPSGQSWSVLTESQYKDLQEEKKAESSPFASLSKLFDTEE
ncbi:DUF177 domain-containing protein [Streptococcus sp.]|nr:YceD family protein [Streptococcus sp.]MDY3823274.1 YceD family protein [Streptococcus sp.]